MANDIYELAKTITAPDEEFIRFQISQAVETYRTLLSLLVQIITVLVVADATVIGYAISTQIASIFLLGILFPITIILVSDIIFRLTIAPIYTAVSLESLYGKGANSDWLTSTFVAVGISPEYLGFLQRVSLIEDRNERLKQLRNLRRPSFQSKSGLLIKIALYVIVLAHILLPYALYHWVGWRLL